MGIEHVPARKQPMTNSAHARPWVLLPWKLSIASHRLPSFPPKLLQDTCQRPSASSCAMPDNAGSLSASLVIENFDAPQRPYARCQRPYPARRQHQCCPARFEILTRPLVGGEAGALRVYVEVHALAANTAG